MLVNKAWKELTLHKTKDTNVESSISIFCRMDVGIWIEPSGNKPPSYFMNKVKQSLNTSIWLRFQDKTIGMLANTFAMVFKQWIMDVHMYKPIYIVA